MRSTYQRKVDKKQIPTCNIMGVNIAAINMEWLLEYLDKNLDDIKGDYICVSNVHTTVTSYEHPSYCSIQNGGLMAIPDGGPLSSVGRKRGYQNMERTTGPSLMGEIFKISAEKGYRHYFYGSTEETLELLYKKLNENYPGIQIAGMYSPPFRSMTEEEDKAIVERINEVNSDFFLHYKFPEVVKEVKPSENADFSVEEIRFQVDENGTLWDILTKSIYTNEFDYIRELVQNAIDATLLKMYSDTNVSLPHQSPRSWNCTDKVMIAYSQKDGVLWVEDYGIGMNEKELSNYLFKTAKSGYQNMGKRTFEFPAIAKFGIGFASCLTKADEIQVITKSKEDKCVKAEIESNSTVAFIEKNVKRDWQGTTIILKVKEKYRFSELKNYINTYFRYPSVEIQLVNVDILDSYIDKDIIFNDKIIQIIEKANHQRNEILSDFLPDRQCLNKLRKILLKNENKKEVLSKIYDVLDNVFHKSYVKENLLDYIRKTEQMNDCINLVRKEVDREIEESEEKIEKYPGFLTVLCQLDLEKTVGYNQLIFEMDNTFDIKEVYKEKKKDSSDRGILFVFTDFADYDLGIEWHSVNAFLFQKNKIVSNFVKFETDLSEESDRNIFSLEEITNADYEISEKLHEPEMEEYYEEYFGGDNEEFYDNPYFCCDVILLNNNNFYFLTSVYEFEIDKITKSNDIIKDYSLGNTIVFPDEYKDECGLFKDSKLYQDGILLDILPQCIVPIGVTYVSVNLTGKSRFELNVSRHELNKNREVIKKWGQKAGKIIQRKVVQNCKQVFEENGLEYDQEDLLVAKGNDDFAKECYENMKNILSEVEG